MPESYDGMTLLQVSQARRRNNRKQSAELLRARSIEFDERNEGAHLIVHSGTHRINFWPGTGKFQRLDGSYSRGVFNLIKYLKEIDQ